MYTKDTSNILLSHATQNSTRSGHVYLDDKTSWSCIFCLSVLTPLSYDVSLYLTMLAYQFEKVVCRGTHCTRTILRDSRRRVAKGNLPKKLITLARSEGISHSLTSLSFVQGATGASI